MTNSQKVDCDKRFTQRPRNLRALSFSCHYITLSWGQELDSTTKALAQVPQKLTLTWRGQFNSKISSVWRWWACDWGGNPTLWSSKSTFFVREDIGSFLAWLNTQFDAVWTTSHTLTPIYTSRATRSCLTKGGCCRCLVKHFDAWIDWIGGSNGKFG